MQLKTTLSLAAVLFCLCVACGGGGSLVPKATPAGKDGPAVARTPLARPGATTAPPGPGPVATQPPVPTAGPLLTYTVESGDTPNAIANKLNVPSDRADAWVTQMLSMNNTTASGLQIGQVLKLPPGATSGPPPPSTGPTGPSTAPIVTPRPVGGTPQPGGTPVIVQLTSPVGRNQEVTLRVRAGANQGCSPTHFLATGGVSGADGLGPRLTDSGGNVSWTFKIPDNTPVGEGSIRVICAGNVAAAPLVVN